MKTRISTQIETDEILPEGGYLYTRRFMTLLINGHPYGGAEITRSNGERWTEHDLCTTMAYRLSNFPGESAEFGQDAESVRKALLDRAYDLGYHG